MTRPHLSVIIPAYNEADRLPLTLLDIDAKLEGKEYSYEILLMNDGSRDKTSEVGRKMAGVIKNLKVIDHDANQGKGAMVREGMLIANGEYRLFMDADNSTSIDHFEKMEPYFKEGYGVVFGSRALGNSKIEVPQPLIRQIPGRMGNLFIQALVLPGIWDTQCGFKAFTAGAAEKIFGAMRITGWGFDIEALALGKKFGFKPKEIPVHWKNDPFSHVRASAYLQVLWETIRIRWWLWRGSYSMNPEA